VDLVELGGDVSRKAITLSFPTVLQDEIMDIKLVPKIKSPSKFICFGACIAL